MIVSFVMHDANAYLEQLPPHATDKCVRINSWVLEQKISAQSDDARFPRALAEHENKRKKKDRCDMTLLRRVLVSRALVGCFLI